jgi:hypothetical protein
MTRPRAPVPLATSLADLAALAALDLVLIPGVTEPIPSYLAERLLPPAPGARTSQRDEARSRIEASTTRVRRPA